MATRPETDGMANVAAVVQQGLCVGCGACVSVCPSGATEMSETPWGALFARVSEADCTRCGLCLGTCPGVGLQPGVLPQGVDPFRGRILEACIVQATDERLLLGSQSGGVTTVLLEHLLKSGAVSGAVVSPMPADGSLRPAPVLTEDARQVRSAQGSKYCPVPACAAAPAGHVEGRSVAFVGVGCQVHAIRNGQQLGRFRDVGFVIGLVCEGTLAYGQIDYLVGAAGVGRSDAAGFRYKSKQWDGWPGDVLVRSRDGVEHRVPDGFRLRSKPPFALPRCRLCFDKLNVLSDLSVGDAWNLREDRRGVSLCLVRTERAREALRSAEKAGLLTLRPADPEDACSRCQQIDQRRNAFTAFTRLAREDGVATPAMGIAGQWLAEADRSALRAYRRQWRRACRLARFRSASRLQRSVRRGLLLAQWRERLSPRAFTRTLRRTAARLMRRVVPR